MSIETVHVVAGILVQGGLFLVAKRNPGGPAGDKWEFPGGKVESCESPQEALVRELKEELDLTICVGQRLGRYETIVGTKLISLECFFVHDFSGEIRLSSHTVYNWTPKTSLIEIDFAQPDIPVVQAILSNP
jgi:8-oxo-dGTP diphosphatase